MPFPHTQRGDKVKPNHTTYRKQCKTPAMVRSLCRGTAGPPFCPGPQHGYDGGSSKNTKALETFPNYGRLRRTADVSLKRKQTGRAVTSVSELQFCTTDTNIPNYVTNRRNAAHPTRPLQSNGIGKKPHRAQQWKDSYGLHTSAVLELSLESAGMPRYFQVQLHGSGQGYTRWV